MLLILFSYIIILFVFLTFGDIFVTLYYKFCKQDEHYSLLELFLLGMILVTIILEITSLWLPSNHYIMLAYIILSILYWIFNQQHFYSIYQSVITFFKDFTTIQWILLIMFTLIITSFCVWGYAYIDSLFYYIQSVIWNETYPVVPGVANLEERLGFNSNFSLISAIFTFSFVNKDAIFTMHVLFAVLLLLWAFREMTYSRFEIKRTVMFILLITYIGWFSHFYYTITTDILPNLILFYIVAKTVLYPQKQKSKYLLYLILSAYLVTLKLSLAPFSLFIYIYFFLSAL
ncbi:MAG: LIC_10190 family membrane protein [Dysgonomonas sp.]